MTIPIHTSTESAPGARGQAFGAAQADRVRNTIASYRRLFAAVAGLSAAEVRDLGARVGEQLASAHPDIADEIDGIARGAGVNEPELFAVNARTEILGGVRPRGVGPKGRGAGKAECTVVGVPAELSADGELLLAQNWDWHPDQAASIVVWRIRTGPDRWLVTLTEAGIVAKIGMNSRGLAVCLNLLGSDQDHGIGGLPIHVLLRLLLERADSLADAVRLVRDARVSASSCLTIGAAAPAGPGLVSAEVTPSGACLVWPDGAGPLVHTNHFLDSDAAKADRLVKLHPDTLTRLRHTRRALAGLAGIAATDIETALRDHADGPHSVCCHGVDAPNYADREATLSSVLMAPAQGRMTVTAGPPCTAEPTEVHP